MAAWQERAAYRAELARDSELVLEPLDAAHAGDFLYQYRDQQISLMTRLPELASAEEFADWVDERAAQPRRIDLAVMHAKYGFVGVVSAHWETEGAFIHFWLGADHQGRGLAARAARLLLRQLTAQGIERAFTAVYPDNLRSLRVLQGLGFKRLPMRASAPEADMLFLAWSSQVATPVSHLCDALRSYARLTGSVFEFPETPPGRSAMRKSMSRQVCEEMANG
jgi:RimJ/RimL family protein N-acetyltransferase